MQCCCRSIQPMLICKVTLQYVSVCCSMLQCYSKCIEPTSTYKVEVVLQSVTVCCSVMQCDGTFLEPTLPYKIELCCRVLQCVEVCCSVVVCLLSHELTNSKSCCSVLQCGSMFIDAISINNVEVVWQCVAVFVVCVLRQCWITKSTVTGRLAGRVTNQNARYSSWYLDDKVRERVRYFDDKIRLTTNNACHACAYTKYTRVRENHFYIRFYWIHCHTWMSGRIRDVSMEEFERVWLVHANAMHIRVYTHTHIHI